MTGISKIVLPGVLPVVLFGVLLAWAAPGLSQAPDKSHAQSHDDGWQLAWVNRARTIFLAGVSKTPGKVLIVGDSISHANPAHRWPRSGSGRTTEDLAIIQAWYLDTWDTGSDTNANHNSGGYLAGADTSGQRAMTASSGITTLEMLTGSNNGGTDMPAVTGDLSTARTTIADGSTYIGNIHIDTLVTAFADAEFAFLMLGTNDVSQSRATANIVADLQTLIAKLETGNIVVVLCTVAPRTDSAARTLATEALNDAIRTLAQAQDLALLDIEAEHLLRDPTSANLLSPDGIHPIANNGEVTPGSDPYAPDGDPVTHTTGSNATQSGYLLHSWLRVQKLKELQEEVVEGGLPEDSLSIQVLPPGVYGAALFMLLLLIGKVYAVRLAHIK